jgi:hypothetical protein
MASSSDRARYTLAQHADVTVVWHGSVHPVEFCLALPQALPRAILSIDKFDLSAGAPGRIRTADPQIRSLEVIRNHRPSSGSQRFRSHIRPSSNSIIEKSGRSGRI